MKTGMRGPCREKKDPRSRERVSRRLGEAAGKANEATPRRGREGRGPPKPAAAPRDTYSNSNTPRSSGEERQALRLRKPGGKAKPGVGVCGRHDDRGHLTGAWGLAAPADALDLDLGRMKTRSWNPCDSTGTRKDQRFNGTY